MLDAAYFRTVGARRRWIGRKVFYRYADGKLAELFETVPVDPGAPADAWMVKCLEWVWRHITPYPRDPLAPKPTTPEVLDTMATHCEGYAIVIVDMAHAALDPAAWPRIRYVIGTKPGHPHHAWAQWRDSKGREWMLDPGQSRAPLGGTFGWTIDAEEIVYTRPLNNG